MESAGNLEEYLLLLLSDSNLPTGGFVASSGLESYVQHGLLESSDAATRTAGILSFIRQSVHSYAALTIPFLSASHRSITRFRASPSSEMSDSTFEEIRRIDALFESMVLNIIARRASTAQGIALLTLYERAFASEGDGDKECREMVDKLRMGIRKGILSGHLVVGFAVLTASLSLSLGASQHLFLFLHARSLLSSAIRMNVIGPYVSHRLLLHDVRPMVADALSEFENAELGPEARTDLPISVEDEDEDGPATTWPLGEILAARHDQLHSKIFNS